MDNSQLSNKLIELEKKLDREMLKVREERRKEHNLLVASAQLLENATVLLPNKKYYQVVEDEAGYIADLIEITKVIEINAVKSKEALLTGYHKLVSNRITVDEERKQILEEMGL